MPHHTMLDLQFANCLEVHCVFYLVVQKCLSRILTPACFYGVYVWSCLLHWTGLLKPQGPGTRSNFSTVRKALRLIVNDEDQMTNPTDISYLYKGYAPLTIRLVETALKGGWGSIAEVLSMLPGAQFDVLQVGPASRPYSSM